MWPDFGDRKSLSIAKNHPKTSQEFSEQFGPSTHNIKGFSKNSHQKVHPNFAKILGRQILGNTLSGPNDLLQKCRTPEPQEVDGAQNLFLVVRKGGRAPSRAPSRAPFRAPFPAPSRAPHLRPALPQARPRALLGVWGFGTSVAGQAARNARPPSRPYFPREGVNREKLTVKKIISITRGFFHRLRPL